MIKSDRIFYAFSLLVGVIIVGVSLTACNRTLDEKPIRFMVSGDPKEIAVYESLVEQFNQVHPEIPVNLIYVAGKKEYREKLGTMFSGRIPPDVFLYNFRRLGDFAESGAVFPPAGFLDKSKQIYREDFYPVSLEAFTYEGQLQCIPQNISSPVIFYNKTLFDEAGIAYPKEGWSQEDFLEIAKALTIDLDRDGKVDQWGFGTRVELIRLAPFIWSNGGDFLDDPNRPTALLLSEPAAADAIQWFIDLQARHGVSPNLEAEAIESSESRFLTGSLAMLMNSRVGVPTMRVISAFEWDAAPLPLGPNPISVLHSDGFCISAQAMHARDHADAVWQFVEFSLSKPGQSLLATTGRTVPSMIKVAESEAFLSSVPPSNNQVWLDAANQMRAFPMLPGWNTFEELASKELQRAYYGDISMNELLENIDLLAKQILE